MKIIFDLDGVLRDLNGYLHDKFNIPYPKEWFWKYQDKDIYDWVKQDNLMPLIYAPPTDYYWIVKHCFEKPEFWTNQPEEWRPNTKRWLDLHFQDYDIKYLTNEEKRKLLDETPDTWLIEDNPLFTSWDRIILIDHPYNRHIKEPERINNIGELDNWIWKMLKQNEVCNEKI